MEICNICHNESVENNCCKNCGRIMGQVPAVFLKSVNFFSIMLTDKYLIFTNSASEIGNSVSWSLGGFLGSYLYRSHKQKKQEFGMIDLGYIYSIDIYFPSSKMQCGAVRFTFRNGTDLVLGIYESGMKKINLEAFLQMLVPLNLPTNVINVEKLPHLKMDNPIVSKNKDIHKILSRSATSFIQQTADRIVID